MAAGPSRGDRPGPVLPSEVRIERFRENADVRSFDCGNRELNDFLTTDEVSRYEEARLGNTYLVYLQGAGELLGYFTISNESLRIEYFRGIKSFSIPGEIRVSTIPGIKVGRLAVSIRHQKRQVGTIILRYITGLALETQAATRILFLEAYPESIEFYQRFGFLVIEHQNLRHRRNRMMWFDLKWHPEGEE